MTFVTFVTLVALVNSKWVLYSGSKEFPINARWTFK